MLVREPHTGHEQLFPFWQALSYHLTIAAISLANLTFRPIAVNGMLEVLLRDTNQNLYGSILRLPLSGCIDYSQREIHHRMAVSATEERLHQHSADHTLRLGKR